VNGFLSVCLLWLVKLTRVGRALGMSAATALLTGFLLSPLTQGAITYPMRNFEAGSGTATVARSESYSHPTPYGKQPASIALSSTLSYEPLSSIPIPSPPTTH
jgi:hypothetical protein